MTPPYSAAASAVVVVGGSAGALKALRTILSTLPAELPAAILVALHTTRKGPGQTAALLQRRTALTVTYAVGHELLLCGHVYIAPPDYHLQVAAHCGEITRDELEHHTRPAVDVLFRSAARDFGSKVIAILLSGLGRDGSAGLMAVQARHGVVIVQAPEDAAFDGMLRRALEAVVADSVLPASEISAEVQRVLARANPVA